nr:putative Ig domain-containing protein [Nitrospirota bacterium]
MADPPVGLVNGEFTTSTVTDPAFGWSARGAAAVETGAAVLREGDRVLSRFAQTFVVPEQAQSLQFTIETAFSDQPSAVSSFPPDAFEVALLDATTGQSLLGTTTGLTQTDALLNIQADGSFFSGSEVRVSSGASRFTNDASRTVVVDLRGVQAGTRATLYLDLLGFGPQTSVVRLDHFALRDTFNTDPVVQAGANATVDEGAPFTRTASFTDPDAGDSWTATVDYGDGTPVETLLVTPDASPLTPHEIPLAHTYADEGLYTVTVAVTDGLGSVGQGTFTTTVQNVAPVLVPIGPKSVNEGDEIRFTLHATDQGPLDGPRLTYAAADLPAGATFNATTQEFAWTPTDAQGPGSYVVTFSVSDGLAPTSEAVTLTVIEPFLLITGTEGDDWLVGTGADDRIEALGGNDVVFAGAGHDVLEGGEGHDVLRGEAGDDQLSGGVGNDHLEGGMGNDVLTGGAGDDGLWGDAGADELRGGDGNDTLYADAEDTVLDGGAGTDLLFVQGPGGVTLDVGQAGIEVAFGSSGHDQFTTSGPDRVVLRGEGGDDQLSGGAGNDHLEGGTGNDRLEGGAGDDGLWGDAGVDELRGGDGNDALYGDADDLVIEGGAGLDVLFVQGPGGVTLDVGQAGIEVAFGSSGHDVFTTTGTGPVVLRGEGGDDQLSGGAGNDHLEGGTGNDVLTGGAGDDGLWGDGGDDTYRFNLGDGVDSIYDTALAGEENRIVFGAGIAPGDLTFTTNGTTLTITVGANGGALHLMNFDPTQTTGSLVTETLQFDDGTVVNLVDLLDPLRSATPAQSGTGLPAGARLTPDRAELSPLLQQAMSYWMGLGVEVSAVERLATVTIRIADLPGDVLGWTLDRTIWLDGDAAGHGWFLDATPTQAEEFVGLSSPLTPDASRFTASSGPATGRMDLLTVLAHELGHVLGYHHRTSGLMQETLTPGTRAGELTTVLASSPQTQAPQDRAASLAATIRIEWAGGSVPTLLGGATAEADDDATRPLPGLVAKPALWLSRFLLDLGRSDQESDPNRTLEIVLPGAERRR